MGVAGKLCYYFQRSFRLERGLQPSCNKPPTTCVKRLPAPPRRCPSCNAAEPPTQCQDATDSGGRHFKMKRRLFSRSDFKCCLIHTAQANVMYIPCDTPLVLHMLISLTASWLPSWANYILLLAEVRLKPWSESWQASPLTDCGYSLNWLEFCWIHVHCNLYTNLIAEVGVRNPRRPLSSCTNCACGIVVSAVNLAFHYVFVHRSLVVRWKVETIAQHRVEVGFQKAWKIIQGDFLTIVLPANWLRCYMLHFLEYNENIRYIGSDYKGKKQELTTSSTCEKT